LVARGRIHQRRARRHAAHPFSRCFISIIIISPERRRRRCRVRNVAGELAWPCAGSGPWPRGPRRRAADAALIAGAPHFTPASAPASATSTAVAAARDLANDCARTQRQQQPQQQQQHPSTRTKATTTAAGAAAGPAPVGCDAPAAAAVARACDTRAQVRCRARLWVCVFFLVGHGCVSSARVRRYFFFSRLLSPLFRSLMSWNQLLSISCLACLARACFALTCGCTWLLLGSLLLPWLAAPLRTLALTYRLGSMRCLRRARHIYGRSSARAPTRSPR
jgi:hypothetical protein